MRLKSSALVRQEQHMVEGESLQPGDEQQMVEVGIGTPTSNRGASQSGKKQLFGLLDL